MHCIEWCICRWLPTGCWHPRSFPGLCSSCQSWCKVSCWLSLCRHTALSVFCHFNNTSKSLSLFWGAGRGWANRPGRHISSIVDLWTERNCSLFNTGAAVVAGKSNTTVLAFQKHLSSGVHYRLCLRPMFVQSEKTISPLVVVMNFTCVCCWGGGGTGSFLMSM